MTPTNPAVERTRELSRQAAGHRASAAARAAQSLELHSRSQERIGLGRTLLHESGARVHRADGRGGAKAKTNPPASTA